MSTPRSHCRPLEDGILLVSSPPSALRRRTARPPRSAPSAALPERWSYAGDQIADPVAEVDGVVSETLIEAADQSHLDGDRYGDGSGGQFGSQAHQQLVELVIVLPQPVGRVR